MGGQHGHPELPGGGGWPVRIHTPTVELPCSGHPAVAAASVTRRELRGTPAALLRIDLPGGRPVVRLTHGADGEVAEPGTRQKDVQIGRTLAAGDVAATVGRVPGDLAGRWPLARVSTGILEAMVPSGARPRSAARRRRRTGAPRCSGASRHAPSRSSPSRR